MKSCVLTDTSSWSSAFTLCNIFQDLDQEDDVPLQQADYELLDNHHRLESAEKKHRDEIKAKVLFEQKGFCKEGGEGDGY